MTTAVRTPTRKPVRLNGGTDETRSTRIPVVWTCFVIAALDALDIVDSRLYSVIIPVLAAAIVMVTGSRPGTDVAVTQRTSSTG